MHHKIAVFDDGEGHAKDIGLLEGAAADRSGGDLAGDGDHRNGVHVGVGDTGDEIGGARTGGGHDHADFTGGAGVSFGHEGSTLFVTGENGADFFRAGEGLVQHHAGATRISEDGVDSGMLEGLDQQVAAHRGGAEFGLGASLGGGFLR